MKSKTNISLFILVEVLLTLPFIALLCAPMIAGAQETPAPASAQSEENILALLKAMFFQLLNSPASLLLTIGISIISAAIDWLIQASERLSNKLINPIVFFLCVLGGGLTYRFFASTGSIDKIYPHPEAVLFVNGLVCGLAAFLVHVTAVKYLMARLNKTEPTKPPTP